MPVGEFWRAIIKHLRIRQAKFPIKKYLEDFDRTKYGEEFKLKFDDLETLDFIARKENIIMIGTPGAGKTHYAIGLGIKACLQSKNIVYHYVVQTQPFY